MVCGTSTILGLVCKFRLLWQCWCPISQIRRNQRIRLLCSSFSVLYPVVVSRSERLPFFFQNCSCVSRLLLKYIPSVIFLDTSVRKVQYYHQKELASFRMLSKCTAYISWLHQADTQFLSRIHAGLELYFQCVEYVPTSSLQYLCNG